MNNVCDWNSYSNKKRLLLCKGYSNDKNILLLINEYLIKIWNYRKKKIKIDNISNE